jgi:hypothetical protein
VSAMTSVTSPMQNSTLPSCGVHSSTRQGTINPLTCSNGSFPTLRQGQSWCMSFDPLRTRFAVAAVLASLGRCGCQRQRICVPAKSQSRFSLNSLATLPPWHSAFCNVAISTPAAHIGPNPPWAGCVYGADTPVWLALDAPQRLTGKFVRDRKVISW